MNYSRGDIVIVPFPFIISGKQKIQKARPAQELQITWLEVIL